MQQKLEHCQFSDEDIELLKEMAHETERRRWLWEKMKKLGKWLLVGAGIPALLSGAYNAILNLLKAIG
jgi:hypothetical protein